MFGKIKRMIPSKDKKVFKKTANRSNVKNNITPRGGIRF